MCKTEVNPYLIATDRSVGSASYDAWKAVNRTLFTKPHGADAARLQKAAADNKKARADMHALRDKRAVEKANLKAAEKASQIEKENKTLQKQLERDQKDIDSYRKQIAKLEKPPELPPEQLTEPLSE